MDIKHASILTNIQKYVHNKDKQYTVRWVPPENYIKIEIEKKLCRGTDTNPSST